VSEQWIGLHNPDWHHSVGVRAWCRCGTWCSDGAECDCCELVELRAEVETLRAQVQAVRDVLGDVSNVYAPSGVSPLVNVSLILEALDGAK
jgi:hypothetical protein